MAANMALIAKNLMQRTDRFMTSAEAYNQVSRWPANQSVKCRV
jgi:hypothetical protein